MADSGASHHVTHLSDILINKRLPNKDDYIVVGKKQIVNVSYYGDYNAKVKNKDGKWYSIKITNVAYVPGFITNVYSITTALSRGFDLGNIGKSIIIKRVSSN